MIVLIPQNSYVSYFTFNQVIRHYGYNISYPKYCAHISHWGEIICQLESSFTHKFSNVYSPDRAPCASFISFDSQDRKC